MAELPYQKIVSLVPSLTELLIYLGLKQQLVGRTRFCIHPSQEVKDLEIIGGTKNPNLEKIIGLKPDFILANKEENREEDIEVLSKYCTVWVTEINTIQDALLEIHSLGEILGVMEAVKSLIRSITTLLDNTTFDTKLSAAYLIWKEPWMAAGKDTYIHDVLNHYGFQNVYRDQKRYPKTTLNELSSKNPDLILLSSEPYPFKEKHFAEIRKACPDSKIELVNGEWFSWYGSRMVTAFAELNKWRSSLSNRLSI